MLSSPDSYALVVLLILVTYAVSAGLAASWAASLVLAVQIATVWVSLRTSRARRPVRAAANVALAVAALAAVVNLFFHDQVHGGIVASWVSCLLYLIAPVSIVRHLVLRRVIDSETLLGAVAAYLMAGMFFAFLYHALGLSQTQPPFFGSRGRHVSQDLFFSFTTLTTTGTATWCRPGTRADLRRARDADGSVVPGHGGGQGGQCLAAAAGPGRAARGFRRRITAPPRRRRHLPAAGSGVLDRRGPVR